MAGYGIGVPYGGIKGCCTHLITKYISLSHPSKLEAHLYVSENITGTLFPNKEEIHLTSP